MFEKQVSYSKIVALIRKAINEVRMNPISLSGYLNSKKSRFDQSDPLMFYPLKKAKQLCVKTKEGIKGIEELDRYLLKQSGCQQLLWSYELHHIAHKKAARLAKSQTQLSTQDAVDQILQMAKQQHHFTQYHHSSHIYLQKETAPSTDNDPKQGVQCILDDEYYIVYYGIIDPKELVSTLLIDDGFPNRGNYVFMKEHRRALLNKRMNHIGIGIHEHPSLCFLVVIILANHVNQIIKQNTQENSNCECRLI